MAINNLAEQILLRFMQDPQGQLVASPNMLAGRTGDELRERGVKAAENAEQPSPQGKRRPTVATGPYAPRPGMMVRPGSSTALAHVPDRVVTGGPKRRSDIELRSEVGARMPDEPLPTGTRATLNIPGLEASDTVPTMAGSAPSASAAAPTSTAELPYQTYERLLGRQWSGGGSDTIRKMLELYGISAAPGSAEANLALQQAMLKSTGGLI